MQKNLINIIRMLWSVVYDFIFYVKNGLGETIPEEIEDKLDVIEMRCRPFAQDYDEEQESE